MGRAPLELAIFDCDGVLVDSERISNDVLARMLTDLGLPTTRADSMRLYMGRTVADCAAAIGEQLGRPLPRGFMDDFVTARMAALERDVAPIDGVEDALTALASRGVELCVASSNARAVTARLLGAAGLARHFGDRVFSAAEDVARSKPHPDVFLHAARVLGRAARACAVVEDSPRGAAAGVAAGMRTLGFARDVPADALRAVGAHPFADMRQIASLLLDDPHSFATGGC